MKARKFINSLLESSTAMVLAYWPGVLSDYGCSSAGSSDSVVTTAADMLVARPEVNSTIGRILVEKPTHAIQHLIDKHKLVVVVFANGHKDISVYSKRSRTKIPSAGLAQLESLFKIDVDTPVNWYRSVIDQPMPLTAGEALYGMSRDEVSDETPIRIPDDIK